VRRLVPFQNVWFLDSLFDSMEKNVLRWVYKYLIQVLEYSIQPQVDKLYLQYHLNFLVILIYR
jgi:hypothetical protein